jgi:hypothetical protein
MHAKLTYAIANRLNISPVSSLKPPQPDANFCLRILVTQTVKSFANRLAAIGALIAEKLDY